MQIYLVGGAVRDHLLGLPVVERDWVVVGANPERMLALGFQPVGKEFPVFLHPKTKEEYALARTERKVGKGYKGFIFYADSHVTLEQDLQRRDLTVNAIAQSAEGELIDPYGGIEDLQHRVLRHVSSAFAEDPVRILRVARFAARLPEFSIHPDTLLLMQTMVVSGEVNALVPERVWQEIQRSLHATAPIRFWHVLAECGALTVLLPELKLTANIQLALEKALHLSSAPQLRFAVLVHQLSLAEIKAVTQRYRLPRDFSEFAELIIKTLPQFAQLTVNEANAVSIWQLFKDTDAIRRSERFADWLLACQVCILDEEANAKKVKLLKQALQAVQALNTAELQRQGLQGLAMAAAIKQQQCDAINRCLKSFKT